MPLSVPLLLLSFGQTHSLHCPRQTSILLGDLSNRFYFRLDDYARAVRASKKSPPATAVHNTSSTPTMSSIPTSSSIFRSIFDAALSDYAKKTGIDLATYPFAQTLQNCQSAHAILDLLQDKAKQFSTYRDGNRKLINCLKPVVHVLHTVSAVLAEATAPVSPTDLSILSDPFFNALPPGAIPTYQSNHRWR
jgi:hypothetical protein